MARICKAFNSILSAILQDPMRFHQTYKAIGELPLMWAWAHCPPECDPTQVDCCNVWTEGCVYV